MKLLVSVVLILISIKGHSQEFKKFRVGIGFGTAKISETAFGHTNPGGILVFVEPSYRISNNFRAGVRLESLGGNVSVASYGINGQYYFSKRNFRPYAGIGLGFYHPRLATNIFYGYSSRLEETIPGFSPRFGFDWKHVSLAMEWNITQASRAIIYPPEFQLPAFNGHINCNYQSIKLIFFIGGGRKRN